MQNRLPVTRSMARRRGAMQYHNYKQCPNGHLSPRYTLTGRCVECGEAVWKAYEAYRQRVKDC